MKTTITIEIEHFDDDRIDEDQKYVATCKWDYEGNKSSSVDAGASVAECVREIGTSMLVMEKYFASIK